MPKLTVWLVRASLIHMALGFLLGSLLLHHKGIPIYDWTWDLREPHIEIMIFGWTMQFIMGIGFWVLPRLAAKNRYGTVRLGWLSFGLLNSGILISIIGALLEQDLLALTGRLVTFCGLAVFIAVIRPRVKPLGGEANNLSSPSVSIPEPIGEIS